MGTHITPIPAADRSLARAGPHVGRHFITGTISSLLLIGVYLGVITAIQGLDHALEQAGRLWYLMVPLVLGFGTQVGLFSFVRSSFQKLRAGARASVATSGGVSTGSMIACCSHHLADVLPALGLAGLSASLAAYQPAFMTTGVAANAVGIVMMLATIQQHQLSPLVAGWRWRMTRVRNVTIGLAAVAVAAAFLLGSGA